ncbi:hypothetical protein IQ07DRAFT_627029 [Pyrenochaeta sp. DS3sAY3a]|nr:hypothetical protein IQ07DRAFT_627029 [Pyrenochaeta sp. DS3sAY3a]
MSSLRIARAALRARPAAIARPLQRRGYAEVASDKIKLSLVLPHQSIYKSQDVVQVNLPAETGEMGVLAGHVPSIEQLKPGLVEVIEEQGSKQFFLSGGFAVVQPDSKLSINAVEGYPLEDFSAEAVRNQIAEAQKIASGSGSEVDIAEAKIELEMTRGFIQPTSSSASRFDRTGTLTQSQPLSTRSGQPARRVSTSTTLQQPVQPPQLPSGHKSPAYLQGKNPYGQLLETIDHEYRELGHATAADATPLQTSPGALSRRRTSRSLKSKARPEAEPTEPQVAPEPIPLVLRQKATPVSVQATKNFFESKAAKNQTGPLFPPSGLAYNAKAAPLKPSQELRPSLAESRPTQRANPAARLQMERLEPYVILRKASSQDPTLTLDRELDLLYEGAGRRRSTNIFTTPCKNVTSLAAARPAVQPSSRRRQVCDNPPLRRQDTPRSKQIQPSRNVLRRRSTRKSLPTLDADIDPELEDFATHRQRRRHKSSGDGRRAYEYDLPAPVRQRRRSRSRELPSNGGMFDGTAEQDTDTHTLDGRFSGHLPRDEDHLPCGFNHDGSSSNPSMPYERSRSAQVPISNIGVQAGYNDIEVPHHVDWRGAYGRRVTKDFGFPGARIKPLSTYRTSQPLSNPDGWVKRSCGHFSYMNQDEYRDDAATKVCRQCSTRQARQNPPPHIQSHRTRRRDRKASSSTSSSSISEYACKHKRRRRQRHSECVPDEKCGDTFAKDMGYIIGAILEEHSSTLQGVINNIQNSQPPLAQLRRMSQDLVQRYQKAAFCTEPSHIVCHSQCAQQANCQPFVQQSHIAYQPCQAICRQKQVVCQPRQVVCQPVYQPIVCEWTTPCLYSPPKAAEKLNVGSPGQLKPNLNDDHVSLKESIKSTPDLVDLINSAADDLGIDLDTRPSAADEEKFQSAPVKGTSQTSTSSSHTKPTEPIDKTVAEPEQPDEDTWLQQTRRHLSELSEARSQLMDELDSIAEDLGVQLQERRFSEQDPEPLPRLSSRVSTGISTRSARLRNKSVDSVAEEIPRLASEETQERRLSRLLSRITTQPRRVSTIKSNLSPDDVQELPEDHQEDAIMDVSDTSSPLEVELYDHFEEPPQYEQPYEPPSPIESGSESESASESTVYEEYIEYTPQRSYTDHIAKLQNRVADLEDQIRLELQNPPVPLYYASPDELPSRPLTPVERTVTSRSVAFEPPVQRMADQESEEEQIALTRATTRRTSYQPSRKSSTVPDEPVSSSPAVYDQESVEESEAIPIQPISRKPSVQRAPTEPVMPIMRMRQESLREQAPLEPIEDVSSQSESEPEVVEEAFVQQLSRASTRPEEFSLPPSRRATTWSTDIPSAPISRKLTELSRHPTRQPTAPISRKPTELSRQPTRQPTTPISRMPTELSRQPTRQPTTPISRMPTELSRRPTRQPTTPISRMPTELSRQPTRQQTMPSRRSTIRDEAAPPASISSPSSESAHSPVMQRVATARTNASESDENPTISEETVIPFTPVERVAENDMEPEAEVEPLAETVEDTSSESEHVLEPSPVRSPSIPFVPPPISRQPTNTPTLPIWMDDEPATLVRRVTTGISRRPTRVATAAIQVPIQRNAESEPEAKPEPEPELESQPELEPEKEADSEPELDSGERYAEPPTEESPTLELQKSDDPLTVDEPVTRIPTLPRSKTVVPVPSALRKDSMPQPSKKKLKKPVNYLPEKQYPPAAQYPARDTPLWTKPDTHTPLPKPRIEKSSPKRREPIGLWSRPKRHAEPPQPLPSKPKPRVRQHPWPFRDHQPLEPFQRAAPGPTSKPPGGTLQRPRKYAEPPRREHIHHKPRDYIPRLIPVFARKDDYYPRLAPVTPERRKYYPHIQRPAARTPAWSGYSAPKAAPARREYEQPRPRNRPHYPYRDYTPHRPIQSHTPEPARRKPQTKPAPLHQEKIPRQRAAETPPRRPQNDKKSSGPSAVAKESRFPKRFQKEEEKVRPSSRRPRRAQTQPPDLDSSETTEEDSQLWPEEASELSESSRSDSPEDEASEEDSGSIEYSQPGDSPADHGVDGASSRPSSDRARTPTSANLNYPGGSPQPFRRTWTGYSTRAQASEGEESSLTARKDSTADSTRRSSTTQRASTGSGSSVVGPSEQSAAATDDSEGPRPATFATKRPVSGRRSSTLQGTRVPAPKAPDLGLRQAETSEGTASQQNAPLSRATPGLVRQPSASAVPTDERRPEITCKEPEHSNTTYESSSTPPNTFPQLLVAANAPEPAGLTARPTPERKDSFFTRSPTKRTTSFWGRGGKLQSNAKGYQAPEKASSSTAGISAPGQEQTAGVRAGMGKGPEHQTGARRGSNGAQKGKVEAKSLQGLASLNPLKGRWGWGFGKGSYPILSSSRHSHTKPPTQLKPNPRRQSKPAHHIQVAMSDEDLEQIRRARLQQLQQQGGGGGSGGDGSEQESQKQREADQRSNILSQILTPDAADRLGRIRLVKESRAADIENRLIMLARTGQIRQKVTEEQLKEILGAVAEQNEKEEQKIVVNRRGGGWDDDDELEELMKDV